jgi:hypothetical protein
VNAAAPEMEDSEVPAYVRNSVAEFLTTEPTTTLGILESRYAKDGFASQYTQQTKAWEIVLPLLQNEFRQLLTVHPQVANWGILFEYPLYRLRKRIDAILLTGNAIIVLETKVGATIFSAVDERQVEDYALDLRDFHAASRDRSIIPLLWCTGAPNTKLAHSTGSDPVTPVQCVGATQLRTFLATQVMSKPPSIEAIAEWDNAAYQPVPTIIQAATSIFAGHDVRELGRADASNLAISARRIVEIIGDAKRDSQKVVVFLTGVPGAGKTLAGLQVVHDAVTTGTEEKGDIVYLSGNTPLVVVLREALARDTANRLRSGGTHATLSHTRRVVRTRIQHITDFLRQYLTDTTPIPHEHAIVFDEAQRAWDAKQGAEKFDRPKSEPSLLLEIMGRHPKWCACVCLVGGGQEINTGEDGLKGWGDAFRLLPPHGQQWMVYGPDDVFQGGTSTGGMSLGDIPTTITTRREADLCLSVPLRSYRSPAVSDWVAAVLDGNSPAAQRHARRLTEYPIILTRSLARAKSWLREHGRGERRYGLLASSGARRLRADGLGVLLEANDGDAIAQWYLNARDDVRSSFFLEVPANEYACQGLEIDHACVCWGGDFVYALHTTRWRCRQFRGSDWNEVRSEEDTRYIHNTYRVLLTRAREGLLLWIPAGDTTDRTRLPQDLDATASFLLAAGARNIDPL